MSTQANLPKFSRESANVVSRTIMANRHRVSFVKIQCLFENAMCSDGTWVTALIRSTSNASGISIVWPWQPINQCLTSSRMTRICHRYIGTGKNVKLPLKIANDVWKVSQDWFHKIGIYMRPLFCRRCSRGCNSGPITVSSKFWAVHEVRWIVEILGRMSAAALPLISHKLVLNVE